MSKTTKKLFKITAVISIFLGLTSFVLFYDGFDSVKTTESPELPSNSISTEMYLQKSTNTQQKQVLFYSLKNTYGLKPVNVIIGKSSNLNDDGLFVKVDPNRKSKGENTLVVLEGSDFSNGTIELEVKGSVSNKASLITQMFSRGFIGVAFRINENISAFESLYLRPKNGVTDNEVRKNHAVQYLSYPDWDFARFREEAPEKYEAAADIAPDEWQKMKIEVAGTTAKLFINDGVSPVLVVNDLKHGANQQGKIGLWVGGGTNGFFRNVKITKK
jgi:hypothetical protein